MNAPASLNSVLSDELVRRALEESGTRRPVEALAEASGLSGPQFVAAAAAYFGLKPMGITDLRACTPDFEAISFLECNQRDPGWKPVQRLIVFTRRVTPRKILIVKIDVGKIVRFEISDPIVRLGLKEGALLNADNVARPVQLNLFWNAFGRQCSCATDCLALECQLQTERGPQLD